MAIFPPTMQIHEVLLEESTHAESVNIILAVQVYTVSSKSATASQTGDTGERGGAVKMLGK